MVKFFNVYFSYVQSPFQTEQANDLLRWLSQLNSKLNVVNSGFSTNYSTQKHYGRKIIFKLPFLSLSVIICLLFSAQTGDGINCRIQQAGMVAHSVPRVIGEQASIGDILDLARDDFRRGPDIVGLFFLEPPTDF